MGHQHSAWTQAPSTDSATGQSVPLLGRGTQLLLCSQVPVAHCSDLQETQKQNSAHMDIWISPGATGISFVSWLLIPAAGPCYKEGVPAPWPSDAWFLVAHFLAWLPSFMAPSLVLKSDFNQVPFAGHMGPLCRGLGTTESG